MLSVCRSFGGPLLLHVSEFGLLAMMRIAQSVKLGRTRQASTVKRLSLSKLLHHMYLCLPIGFVLHCNVKGASLIPKTAELKKS